MRLLRIVPALILAFFAMSTLHACGPSPEDVKLREAVETEIMKHKQLAAAGLKVEVEQGVIEISGTLSTQRQRANLAKVVQEFKDEGHEVKNKTRMQERDSGLMNEDAYGPAPGLGL